MRITYAQAARADLNQAYWYIARHSPVAARRALARVIRTIEQIATGNIHGREVQLLTGESVRKRIARPYGIYYQVIGDTLEVARVYHLSRRSIER